MPTIKCNNKQIMLIEIALDTLSRMTCGQLNEAIRGMERMKGEAFPFMNGEIQKQDKCLDELKSILFPELHPNASYGVGKCVDGAQIAYEMVKKLQNFRTKDMKEAGVLKYETLHYSKEPLIEIHENNKNIIQQKCPICEGKGIVPSGFYNTLPGCTSISSNSYETCRNCESKGVVFIEQEGDR